MKLFLERLCFYFFTWYKILKEMLRKDMAAFIPVLILLLLISGVIYFVNFSSTLAPFVYSFF